MSAPPPPPGPLAWERALQVTAAALIAMLCGIALSPQRWFWAVIAAYVVFLNTRSRGDTIHKASHRMVGTLAGLFGGLGVAAATAEIGVGADAAQVGIGLLAVFCLFYFYAVSYSIAIFCVTVLLGLIYGALGNPLESLLILRLEETAIGTGAAILAASFILPTPTRGQVRMSGAAVLTGLRDVLAACVAEPAGGDGAGGDGGLAAIGAVRQLDRRIADLRLAMAPLTAGRSVLRRGRADRPVTALLACADAARSLAAASATLDPDARRRLVHDARQVEARLSAMIEGEAPSLADVPSGEAEDRAPAVRALRCFDRALTALAERLAAGRIEGFAIE